MIISPEETEALKSMYNDSILENLYLEKLEILKGKDDELNNYHLCIESLVNRFEKSLWDMLRIFTPLTCSECIQKYYGEDPMIKGKFLPLKKLHKLVKDQLIIRKAERDKFNNLLSDQHFIELNKYLDLIYPFFDIRNALAHQIKEHEIINSTIHPLNSGISDQIIKKIFENRTLWKYEIIKGFELFQLYKHIIRVITKEMNGLTDDHFNVWSDLVIE